MAFHHHLIEVLLNNAPAAGPQLGRAPVRPAQPKLFLHWEPGSDGRPWARWIRD